MLPGHEIETAAGNVEALVRVRDCVCDVVITDADTAVAEDLAFAPELRRARPGVKIIVLAPEVKHEDVVEALRAQVFACFTPPYDFREIASMARAAITAQDWRHGIEVVSGLPHWFTLRVSCHLLTAERLVRFMTEHQSTSTLPPDDRDLLITAFREMLVNSMEHGAGFNPDKVIEVTAARTGRAIVYHFRDPGSGFDRNDLAHATRSSSAESVRDAALKRAELGLRPGGFGLLIARHIADELVFNERGNEVLLIKYLS
jgi:anti-sigma regulatory factor (Ser/Thr protein kinase)/CheY-like chemotaxis protein